MMAKINVDLVGKGLLLGGWLTLFIGGAAHYSGSWLAYTTFSLVFLTMLISGFYRQVSYGYLFLVVMLWLGFWLKLTVHLLVDYPFGEPFGFFTGSPAAWDEVLWIATIGGAAVMAARLLYGLFVRFSAAQQHGSFEVPAWYSAMRGKIWASLVFACVGLAIVNAALGTMQIGLVPSTILWWPLNAVISWLIGYGLTFAVATLLWWDIALGRNVSLVVYFVLLEAFTSTVSVLSRGVFIFHAIPILLAMYKNKDMVSGWSRRNTMSVCAVFIVLLAISNPLVNTLRNYYYSDVPLGSAVGSGAVGSVSSAVGSVKGLAKFAVDRWLGLEGVMAVAAYPNKGEDLFVHGLTERREIGKSTIYQEICQTHYRFLDMQKFEFASMPGAVGFLYFTGNYWVVALGMVLLVLGLLYSEALVFKFTCNPLLSALWGGVVANVVAQIGVAPRSLLLFFFEMTCGIAAIWVIQSRYFSGVLQKFVIKSAGSSC